jgi:hypothetical protein
MHYNDIFNMTKKLFSPIKQRICHAFISEYYEIWKQFGKKERKLESTDAEK